MDFVHTMLAIQRATRDAKARTGDKTLGTRAGCGTLQIVRVIKHKHGPGCDVLPVTDFLSIPDAIHALKSL